MSNNQWRKIGSMRKSKTGGTYIKIDEDVTLSKDAVIQVQDPRKKLDEAVESGRLTSEKAEAIRAKIPDYILRDLVLPPPQTK